MATKVGTLEVDVTANLAKLYDGMTQATNAVNKAAESMKAGFDGVGKSIVSMAAKVASVAAIGAALKSAISFGDELQTTSERLGITVDRLQELSGIAVQSDTNLEALGKSFKFLGDSMVKAGNAGSEQQRLFAALGVSVKNADGSLRAVDDVMGDVAEALQSVGNETTRTAAGVAIFGKSYLEIAAALRTYKDAQEEARAVMEQFGTVTATSTKAADALGDRVKLLAEGFKAATLTGLTGGLAALDEALKSITPTIALLSKAFGDFFGMVGEKAAILLVNVIDVFKKMGAGIAALAAAIATQSLEPFKELTADILKLERERIAEIGKIRATAKLPGLDDSDQVSRAAGAHQRLADSSKKVADALTAQAKEVLDLSKSISQLLTPINDLNAKLGEETVKLRAQLSSLQQYGIELKQTSEVATEYEIAHGKLGQTLEALRLIFPDLAAGLEAKAIAQAKDNDALGRAIELEKQYVAAVANHNAELAKSVQGIVDETEKELIRAQEIGLTREQIVGLTIAREQDYVAALRGIEGADLEIRAAEARIAALEKLRVAVGTTDYIQRVASAWADLFRGAADAGARFLTAFAEHGRSAFKRLWDDFKAWALEALAKVAATQIVVAITGLVAPSLSGAASNALVGSAGSVGNILGGGKDLIGAAGSLFSNTGTLATSFANLNLALTAGVDSIGGFGAALTASLPALGTIVGVGLAAYALYQYLESKKGGPKEGGFAATGFESTRGSFFPGESTTAGDQAIAKLVDSVSKSFETALGKLGGKAFDYGFALGYSTDPRGKALSNVHGEATVGGRLVFQNPNPNVGRTPEELQAELQHQAAQMLLAALQSSDLPKAVAAIIDSVDVFSASTEEINNIIAAGAAIKGLTDSFPALNAQLDALDPSQITAFVDALGGVDKLTASFQYLQQNFTTSAEKTKKTSDQLTADFAALGQKVPASHQAFMDLLDGIDLTTEGGRELYASLLQLGPEFVAVAGSAEDAARKLANAQSYFQQNFYTSAEQHTQAVVAATSRLDAAASELNITIPRTMAGFRDLVESLQALGPAGEALLAAVLPLAPDIVTLTGGLSGLSDAATTAAAAVATLVDVLPGVSTGSAGIPDVSSFIDKIASLADQLQNATVGDKLTFQLNALDAQITETLGKEATAMAAGDYYLANALDNTVTALRRAKVGLAANLADYVTLQAQFGAAQADQLYDLEKWYNGQKAILAGSGAALAALDVVFRQRWDAIVNGVAQGVTDVVDELGKLRAGIADWLKGLQIGNLSPLTPAQKLAEAQQQYQAEFLKAAQGDKDALGDITKFADAYLQQARDFYASSPIYTEIFDRLTEQLGVLAGTLPTGAPLPAGIQPEALPLPQQQIAALQASLPASGQMVSNEDLRAAMVSLQAVIADALAAVADANTQDSQAVVNELRTTANIIVDGLGGTLK